MRALFLASTLGALGLLLTAGCRPTSQAVAGAHDPAPSHSDGPSGLGASGGATGDAGDDPLGGPDAPDPTPASVARKSWESCPADTTLKGAEPPAGTEQYCVDAQNQRHGFFTRWHANGRIRAEGEYKHGQLVGMYVSYFENGTVEESGHYEAGQKSGQWRGPDGEGEYRQGQKHGMWTEPTGRGAYKNGQRNGFWVELDQDGNEVGNGAYKNGVKDGTWNYHYEHWRVVETWKNGEKQSEREIRNSGR